MTAHDPALLWAANKANLPYERFVAGLTPETTARIRTAFLSRYVYSAPAQAPNDSLQPDPHTEKDAAHHRISAAFQAKKHTIPREIRPEEYASAVNFYPMHTTHNIPNFFSYPQKLQTSPMSTPSAEQIRFNTSSRTASPFFIIRRVL